MIVEFLNSVAHTTGSYLQSQENLVLLPVVCVKGDAAASECAYSQKKHCTRILLWRLRPQVPLCIVGSAELEQRFRATLEYS